MRGREVEEGIESARSSRMGGGGGDGGGVVSRGNGAALAAAIPAGARKMVQSLKEIVNLPEQEIYVTLKECGMDPSEAVQRLLSQDSFHEVKSKRDKKKEMKEPPDSRSQTTIISSGRGIRGGSDRGPRPSSIQSSSNGYGITRGKVAQKKEDGVCSDPSSSSMGSGTFVKRKSAIISENASTENLSWIPGVAEGNSLQTQPSSGCQHGWAGMPGHFSMADIVKMGRPQGKLCETSTVAGNSTHVSNSQIIGEMTKHPANHSVNQVQPIEVDQGVHSSHDPHQQAEDATHEPGTTRNNHVSQDSWPSVNQPNSINSVMLETFGAATSYADISKSAIVVDEDQLHESLHEDEIPESEHNVDSESSTEQSLESESISERELLVGRSEGKFKLDDGSQHNLSAYLSQGHLFEQQVDVNVEVSLAAANLQNLSLQKDGLAAPSLEDNPAVIIPRHLQVTNADCSHLSFGSFGSGIDASFSGSSQSNVLHNSSEVTKVAEDVPPLDHSDARNSNYYDRDELKSQINEVAVSSVGISTMNYDASSASEPEVIRDDAVNNARELQYNFPSLSSYGTSTSMQHSATEFAHQQTNLQMQNLTSLSTLMQYNSSLPSGLLGSTLQPLRDIDIPLSSFLTTQSVPAKHTLATSINGPTISMSEMTPSVFSNLQPVPQSSPSTNLPAGHAIPQHLPIHPYSQATLPLGPFANMISYQFLPQNYTYLPSTAFPQAYSSNGPFHQSQSAVHNAGLKYTLPQYKSSIPVSSLLQPAAVPSAYGNYSGSTNIPANFALNPSTTSTNATLGFDEAMSTQKEGSHYLHLQQNESLPTWLQGGNSRAVSSLPPNTFYGFQGQNQLNNFRQAPQPSHYGQMGYLNFYQNQLGGQSQEHPQNPSEANLNVSQGNPSQQSHQIWQHGY